MTGNRVLGPQPARTVALAGAMQLVGGGIGWSLVPPLLPLIGQEIALSHAMAGVVWGAAPLGIAVASPFGGAAVDRWGARRVAGVAMLVGALACAARAFVGVAWTLAASMFLFGVHIGFVAPALPKVIAGHVRPGALGRANGFALLCYTLGTAATVLTARTVLVPVFGGWRPTMLAAAAAMAAMGLLWLGFVRDRGPVARHAGLARTLQLARDTQLLRVAGVHFLLFGGYLAMLGALPRALGESGVLPSQVGATVALWLLVAGAANLAGPWLSDRMGRRRPLIFVGAATIGAALAGLAVAPASATIPLLLLAALGGGCFAPLMLTLPLELPGIGVARAGAAMGLLMLVGQAGGFLLPVVCGAAVGATGSPVALFSVLALAHLAILAVAKGLRETGPGKGHETDPAPRPAAQPKPGFGAGTGDRIAEPVVA